MSNKQKFHYCYLIANIQKNKFYIGTRSCYYKPIEDIGFKYFSSSHDEPFILEQKEHPENFEYQVLQIFNDRKDAINFEISLHIKFNVGCNPLFYNRSKQTSTGFDQSGKILSEEHKRKISKANKGNYHSKETRKKMSEALKGRIPWNKSKLNCFSQNSKKKMSNSAKGCSNSQFGTMWIRNLDLKQSKKIKKSDPIPTGWKKGRKINFK